MMARLRSLSFWTVLVVWSLSGARAFRHIAQTPFQWDSFGYHLYLPAIFSNQDLFLKDLAWVEEARTKHAIPGTLYQISDLPEGRRVIKYPMGLALIWGPWYLLGDRIADITGHEKDGYSAPYGISIRAGVFLYLLLGLLALRRVLLVGFSELITSLTLLLLFSATNLVDQATTGLVMPHLPLFALYGGLLWATLRWTQRRTSKRAFPVALLMGLAILIRPSEVVCLLLPLLWCGENEERAPLRRNWTLRKQWFGIAIVMFFIGFPQFIYWKAATGTWFVDTYNNAGEGFDFTTPHTWPFLFGFRKGWFIYTPLMLFASIGMIAMGRYWRRALLPIAAFFIANLYLLSSWTCWWYADSFSSRAMVGSYAIMALPLAAILQWASSGAVMRRVTMATLMVGCTALNLFQYAQFNSGILHSSRMTRRAYLASFGRTTVPDGYEDLLLVKRSYDGSGGFPDPVRYQVEPGPPVVLPAADTLIIDLSTGIEHKAYRLEYDRIYSPAVRIPFDSITSTDHAWVEAVWQVRCDRVPVHGSFISSMEHNGKSYGYSARDLRPEDVVPGTWRSFSTYYLTPEVRSGNDEFVCYFWLRDSLPIWVEGPLIKIHKPRPTE